MRAYLPMLASLLLFALPALSPEASGATTHTVKVSGFSFTPSKLTIDAGDTVQWLWGDGDHTVTENQLAFNQVLDKNNQTVTVTFDSAFLANHPRINNIYDYFCIPHQMMNMVGTIRVNQPPPTPWVDIGFGLAGTNGIPALVGKGAMSGGSNNTMNLSNAKANSLCILFVTVGTNTPTPFAGGTIATIPVTTLVVLNTGPSGAVPIPFVFPNGVPAGTPLTFQYGIDDSAAVQNVALSNALQVTTP